MMAKLGKDRFGSFTVGYFPKFSETAPKSSFFRMEQQVPLGTARGSNSTSRGRFWVPEDLARLLEELSLSVPGCPVSHLGDLLDPCRAGFSPEKQERT